MSDVFSFLAYNTGTRESTSTSSLNTFLTEVSQSGNPYSTTTYKRTIFNPDGVSEFLTNLTNPWVVFGSHNINNTGIVNVFSAISSIELGNFGTLQNLFDPSRVTLFYIRTNPASGTYTFSAPTNLTFRTQDGQLPFGSFPGVGTFFT